MVAVAGVSPRVICLGPATGGSGRPSVPAVTDDVVVPAHSPEPPFSALAVAALACAHLGGEVSFWGEDGADPAIRSAMEEEGIVWLAAEGPAVGVSPLPLAEVAEAGAVLADPSWRPGAVALFGAARRNRLPSILLAADGPLESLRALLTRVDFALFAPRGLARFAAGAPADALARVRGAGAPHAGVTQAERGYLWRDSEGLHRMQAFSVMAVDNAGADEAFWGAFTLGLAEGRRVRDCLRMANATAALTSLSHGIRAGLPDRATLDAFLATEIAA